MRERAHSPAARRADARNLNLAIREFEELRAGPGVQRCCEALRTKHNRQICRFERVGHRKVVAQRAVPRFKHMRIVKSLAANRSAAAPAEVVALPPEESGNSGVPRRREGARECARTKLSARNDPTIGGGRADAYVLERRNEFGKPSARQPHVGIGKNENFEIGRDRIDGAAKIKNLLAATLGRPGDYNVNRLRARGFYALDDLQRRIEARGQRKIDFVVGILEAGERREIIFEPALNSLAGTYQRSSGSVKSCVRREPAPHHSKPLEAVPE